MKNWLSASMIVCLLLLSSSVFAEVGEPEKDEMNHSLVFVRGSVGALIGDGDVSPALGGAIGWRYRFHSNGFEITALDILAGLTQDSSQFLPARISWLHHFSPDAIQSWYSSVGASVGILSIKGYSTLAFTLDLGVGYEFSRSSRIRTFVEAHAIIPTDNAYDGGPSVEPNPNFPPFYLMAAALSVGIGF